MPRWISKDGKWVPAKEKVNLTNYGTPFQDEVTGETVNTGDPYIYNGPDRAALFHLWKESGSPKDITEETAKQLVDHVGIDFQYDADLLNRVRQLGFKSISEYKKFAGYDPTKSDKDFTEKASQINRHELPKKVAALKVLAGGKDTSGQGADKYGGFESPKDA